MKKAIFVTSMKQTFRNTIVITAISLLTVLSSFAQDPEFTQFYAAPVYTNPAMAGSAWCGNGPAGRFASSYRMQWPNLPGTFRTLNASWDQHIEAIGGGLGVMITSDRAGSGLLTTDNLNAVYSYVLRPSRTKNIYMRFGIQAGFAQKRIDFSKLRFPDQILPTRGFVLATKEPVPEDLRITYPNFAGGFLFYTPKFYAGVAAHNITEPVQSFYGNAEGIIPRRYTAHAGANIKLRNSGYGNSSSISPNVLFMKQLNFTQLNMGFYYSKGPLVSGLWFRQTFGEFNNSDAIIALLGFRKDKFKFGYSFDITVSSGRSAIKYSHEVSATVDWCIPKGALRIKPTPCPTF